MNKLKELYNNIDVDYNRVQLYFKNCTEIEDWYYKELIEIYKLSANLKIFTETEEFHGIHKFQYYTDESLNKIKLFINNLNKLLKDEGNFNRDYTYNSSDLIN